MLFRSDLIRAKLRREKAMKLALPPSPGRAYTADEKARMLAADEKWKAELERQLQVSVASQTVVVQ